MVSALEIFTQGELPRWGLFRQRLDAGRIDDVAATVAVEFGRPEVRGVITPGSRVALTAGSRGVDRIAEVLRVVAIQIRALGGEPFIVPAMGSHGGATAAGQLALLAHYGITEEAMGCPLRASMETVQLGELEEGIPVFLDRIAFETADLIIPINRVKPHTDFHGPVESGLMKMIAIGLGKQHGADTFHRQGFGEFARLIPAIAHFTVSRVDMPFGLALIENGYGQLGKIEAVPAKQLWEREQALLRTARERMARLPQVPAIDVLIVDRIGKDISGDGADPNVINRDCAGVVNLAEHGGKPAVQRLIVRDLTDDTEGNASGIGMFDFALRRAVDRIDPVATYMNMLTAKVPAGARIPITLDTDREALHL
nr:hypothetical protein [Chloroflexota bacterium]